MQPAPWDAPGGWLEEQAGWGCSRLMGSFSQADLTHSARTQLLAAAGLTCYRLCCLSLVSIFKILGKDSRDPAWLAFSPMWSGCPVWLLSLDHEVSVVEGSFQNEEDCCLLKKNKTSVGQNKKRCPPHIELGALGKPKKD